MKHQVKVDAELRKQELKAYTDSMALLANAISSRQQPISFTLKMKTASKHIISYNIL